MTIIVLVAGLLELLVSEPQTETMGMLATGMGACYMGHAC